MELLKFESQDEKYLVIYDISNDSKRRKLAKYLEEYGVRVQKSAFIINASSETCKIIWNDVQRFMDACDNIRISRINSRDEYVLRERRCGLLTFDVMIM